jgi:hypothetical protein
MKHGRPLYSQNDAACYLAAILPELAKIARRSNIEDLGAQIEQAARMAQKSLITRER